jgi:hypothetical protein
LVSRQKPKNLAWKVISLRHVSLREMGWSRKPYEFQLPSQLKSKGGATYGAFRKHAFLASKSFVPFLERIYFASLGLFANAAFAKETSSALEKI